MKLSVVIPAYNEEAILPKAITMLTEALEALCADAKSPISEYTLLIVSDGSTDKTPIILQDAAKRERNLVPIVYTPNRGKGCAIRHGICASTPASDGSEDYVLYTDCDLAYGTDVIGQAVTQLCETQADILIGSRAIHPDGYAGYTPLRKFASILYLRFLSVAAGFPHSDSQAGFKAMRGAVGREIFAQCTTDGFAFDFEMLMRAQKAGCTFTEMPIKIVNHRQSSIHLIKDSLHMLRDIAKIKKDIK